MVIFKHKRLSLLCVILSVTIRPFAATDSNFDIRALVLGSITLTVINPLQFGEIDRASSIQTRTITPNDTGAGVLDARGEPDRAVSGAFGSNNISLACDSASCSGSPAIIVSNFTCGNDLNSSCQGNLNNQGDAIINIGATETIQPTSRAGNYSGTQTFTIDYA